MKLTDGEKMVNILVVMTMIVLVVWGSVAFDNSNDVVEPQSFTKDFVDELPEDGTPVLMIQSKVGDDVTPIVHQTWCQVLPYKRNIGDDRIFCYVEVIDDWVVE